MKTKLDILLSRIGDMALKRRARRVIDELGLKNGDKILDLGCGNGYFSFILSRLPLRLEITGIDSDLNAIKEARNLIEKKKAKFVIGEVEKMPFPKKYFDKVIMSEIIEHVKDDMKVLKEARRVLKPGGVLILTTPNKDYPFLWDPINWMLEHFFNFHISSGFFAGIWNQHLRLYRPEEIKINLEKSGFRMVTYELLTGWCLPFNHYLLNLGARLLYNKQLSKDLLRDINKFDESKTKKTGLANFLFWVVNTVDKLNDLYSNSSGVSIFVKALN